MYVKGVYQHNIIIICLYVDDPLITWRNLKLKMCTKFGKPFIGDLSYFLDLKFTESPKKLGNPLEEVWLQLNKYSHGIKFQIKPRWILQVSWYDNTFYKKIVGLRYTCNFIFDICHNVACQKLWLQSLFNGGRIGTNNTQWNIK